MRSDNYNADNEFAFLITISKWKNNRTGGRTRYFILCDHWLLVVSCFLLFPLKYIYAWVMGRKMQTNSAVVYGKIGELTGYLADRIIDVMDGPEEEQNATAAFPETGDIHFKDITFTYPETDQPALECQHE